MHQSRFEGTQQFHHPVDQRAVVTKPDRNDTDLLANRLDLVDQIRFRLLDAASIFLEDQGHKVVELSNGSSYQAADPLDRRARLRPFGLPAIVLELSFETTGLFAQLPIEAFSLRTQLLLKAGSSSPAGDDRRHNGSKGREDTCNEHENRAQGGASRAFLHLDNDGFPSG